MGVQTSKNVSSQAVHRKCCFDNLTEPVKVIIFALLPYSDLSHCFTLNITCWKLIISNRSIMRKVHSNQLSVSSTGNCPKKDFYSIKCWKNFRVYFSPKQAYTIGRSPVINSLFGKSDSWFSKLSYLKKKRNFPIDSMTDGIQRMLDYTLSKANPYCICLDERKNNVLRIQDLIFILKESFKKHGTKAYSLYISSLTINQSVMEMINVLGCPYVQFFNCSFENTAILGMLDGPVSICVSDYASIESAQNPDLYRRIIENWKKGLHPWFYELYIEIQRPRDLTPIAEFLKETYNLKCDLNNLIPIRNEVIILPTMEYTRFDGWKLSLEISFYITEIRLEFVATLNGQMPKIDDWSNIPGIN